MLQRCAPRALYKYARLGIILRKIHPEKNPLGKPIRKIHVTASDA